MDDVETYHVDGFADENEPAAEDIQELVLQDVDLLMESA